MSRDGAYTLDDTDETAEEVELFYREAGGSSGLSAPPQPDFLPMTTPSSTARNASGAPSVFSVSNASAGVAQFEVEEPKRIGAKSALWRALAPEKYNTYFQLTVTDLVLRLSRALVPTAKLLDPPPSSTVGEVDADTEVVGVPTGIGSVTPFNEKVDLYGPVWLTTTLVLCIAVGANILVVLRALALKSDPAPRSVSALTALNFRHLVQAGSIVYSYTAFMTAATIAGKRYIGDASACEVTFVLCIYGYAAAPFVPAVLLCSIPNAWLNWMFMLAAVAVSAYFICLNLWPANIESAQIGTAYGVDGALQGRSVRWRVRAACIACHLLFGVILKLRFF